VERGLASVLCKGRLQAIKAERSCTRFIMSERCRLRMSRDTERDFRKYVSRTRVGPSFVLYHLEKKNVN
jgi:hypothetical protein